MLKNNLKMEKLFMKKIGCCSKCPAFAVSYAIVKEGDAKHCDLYDINLFGFDTDNQTHKDCQLLDADKILEIKIIYLYK